ncbi:ABC transporter substrate-binding protein [Salipaludibacillus agaradhaerens]|uniref:ABC transporter substrate-binding protein n=1 Tax=Salipaludibacillus agaradhaerens TaxID=76935 RepID=UPI0009965437|nr:iron-siderophore ABC transporter substrate-binding protein [Salipaludibacillus agaradhaerens]
MYKIINVKRLLPSLFLFFLLAACGDSEESVSSEEVEGDTEGTRVIQHALGETEITGEVEKIVTLYQGANDVAVALDVKPIGIVESWVEKPVYTYLRDELDGVELVGEETQPNLEAIAELEPDLIIASRTRHEEVYDHLNDIAPTVVGDEVYDWKGTLDLMGKALNKEAEANQLLEDYNARIDHFKGQLGDELPIEVAITNFRADHARIFYMGFAGGILEDAGFTRPEGHDDPELWGIKLASKESIPEADAEVIFNFNSGAETDQIQQTYEEWTGHPLWKELEAVKNDQVIMVDEVTWNSAGGYLSAHMVIDDLYDIFNVEE